MFEQMILCRVPILRQEITNGTSLWYISVLGVDGSSKAFQRRHCGERMGTWWQVMMASVSVRHQ
jgi:hypothetical protein